MQNPNNITPDPQKQIQTIHEQIKHSMSREQYEEALTYCEQLLSLGGIQGQGHVSDTYQYKLKSLIALRRYEEARLLELPSQIKASKTFYIEKIILLNSLGAYEEALQCFQNFDKNLTNPDDYNLKGVTLSGLHRYAGAIAYFSKAIDLATPDLLEQIDAHISSLPDHFPRPSLYRDNRDYKLKYGPSRSQYLFLKFSPITLSTFYTNKGYAEFKLEKYEEAISSCNAAILNNLEHTKAYELKGDVLSALSLTQESFSYYIEAISRKPNYERYIKVAKTLYSLGKYEESIAYCNKARNMNEQSTDSYYYRGKAFLALKQTEQALRSFNAVLHFDKDHYDASYNIGLIFFELGDKEKALQYYDKTISLNPYHSDSYYHKARTLYLLARNEEAIECFYKVISLDFKNANSYYYIGKILSEEGRYVSALAHYNKSIALGANDSNIYNCMGLTLRQLGKYEEAIKCFDKAIHNSLKDHVAYNNKGLTLLDMQETQEAIACFEEAIDLNSHYHEAMNNLELALRTNSENNDEIQHTTHQIDVDTVTSYHMPIEAQALLAVPNNIEFTDDARVLGQDFDNTSTCILS